MFGFCVMRFIPEAQIFAIARRDLAARHQKQISGVHAFAGEQRQRVRIARVNPDRRMGFLQRLYAEGDVFILVRIAVEAERSVARKRLFDEKQGFVGDCPAILEIGAIGAEEIRHDSRDQAELEAAVGDVIQHGGVFGDA